MKAELEKNFNPLCDSTTLPYQSVEIISGCEPKVKCKNKILQKIFVKLFGYKVTYKTVQAKIMVIKLEDCPKGFNDITFIIENKQ